MVASTKDEDIYIRKSVNVSVQLCEESDIKGKIVTKQDDGGRIAYFNGYASTFGNEDSDNDIIEKGAFEETLKETPIKDIKMLWQHDYWSKPLGRWITLQEDEKGLFVEGELFYDTQEGGDMYTLLKGKAVDKMSIGFRVREQRIIYPAEDDPIGRRLRYISKLDLHEISLVNFPANDQADILEVRSKKDNSKMHDELVSTISDAVKKCVPIAIENYYKGRETSDKKSQQTHKANQGDDELIKAILQTSSDIRKQ